jgi:hypothetical protein
MVVIVAGLFDLDVVIGRLPTSIVSAMTEFITPFANTSLERTRTWIGDANLRKVDQLRLSSSEFESVRTHKNATKKGSWSRLVKFIKFFSKFSRSIAVKQQHWRAKTHASGTQGNDRYSPRIAQQF